MPTVCSEEGFKTMRRIQIKAPAKYVQGAGSLQRIGKLVTYVGKRFLVISDAFAWGMVAETVEHSLKQADRSFVYMDFGGECTEGEIQLTAKKALEEQASAIIGIGGGKILDTAKAAAEFARIPVVLVPTAASSDAPCSAVAVLYHKDHSFDRYLYTEWGPEMVIVDSQIIANAPAKLLAAGMADALSTWMESKAYVEGIKQHNIEHEMSMSMLPLAKIGYDQVMRYGKQAFADVKKHQVTEAVDQVIEANIYISGVSFENTGLAAAHSIANALTHVKGLQLLHGEGVALGIIVQMKLEQRTAEEIAEMEDFLRSLELPTRLKDLPMTFSKDILENIADHAAHSYETNVYLPFDMSEEAIMKILSE